MSYEAKVIADSVAPHGVRITTIQVTFPRFILAEFNTHRVLSRNSASSRAIPPERLIERVRKEPFVPETFNRRVKGMGVGAVLDDQGAAKGIWLEAAGRAADAAEALMTLDVDKSRVNRLLEPFLWHTALVTATEWSNFFALRDHPAAQPEMQITARAMREAMDASTPQQLEYGQWHLPYVRDDELAELCADCEERPEDALTIRVVWARVSAGRCFVVSYDRLDEIMYEPKEKSIERADRGSMSGHWSPLEHPAVAVGDEFYGNFRGWRQLRKLFAYEDDFSKLLAVTGNP